MPAPLITEGDCFISRFTLKPECRDEFLAMFTGLVENFFRDAMGETPTSSSTAGAARENSSPSKVGKVPRSLPPCAPSPDLSIW